MLAISTPARLMVRPFRVYREIAALPEGAAPTAFYGMARFLFVFAAFISVTATGRFAPMELASAIVSMSYVPVLHFVALGVATRVFVPRARGITARRAYALYAEGYGPWFLVFVVVAGGALFLHEPARLVSGPSSLLILGALAWSSVLTFACFRAALALSFARALGATLLHYLVHTCLILGYYTAAGQLLPIIPR